MVPIDKVGTMEKDARFTVVGMVERSSTRPIELVSSSLFCSWAALSDGGGKSRVSLFISLWYWDSHPKCVRRGDILVCRNCRNDGKEKGISLKMPAGCWILVSGDRKDPMPPLSFLTEAETRAVQTLRRVIFDVRFDCKFIPQAYVPHRRHSSIPLLLASKPPLYRHLEEGDLDGGNEISLDAVQVVILWPFHDSYWGAVLWDGYGFGSWASCLNPFVVAILQDAVTFCDGWIRIVDARLQVPEFTDRPELLLCNALAISPKNEDVLYRLEHLGAFGPFDIAVLRKPVILSDWHNCVWLCSSCSSSSYWPKTFCFCCGKRFDVMRDAVVIEKFK